MLLPTFTVVFETVETLKWTKVKKEDGKPRSFDEQP